MEGAARRPGGIARTYALVFGLTYLAVALIEVLLGDGGLRIGDTTILELTALQNAIHWLVGLVVLGSYFMGERAAKMTARVIGIVFVALTILGFVAREFTGELLGFEGALPWSYNLVHLITAIAALFAGFAAEKAYSSRTQMRRAA
ncbi:MAG TPA: DUF4383 domain-containing protein [Actinomycetota bacterium]|nr:DUF4383 domain-containing protein [Actinomycetota bacterium]